MEVLANGKIKRSESEWREVYERYLTSGLSANRFCKTEQLAASSFSKWLRKFEGATNSSKRQRKKKPNFVELVPQAKPSGVISVELELGNGQILRLRG